MLERILVLMTGGEFTLTDTEKVSYDPDSFTSKTIHKFVCKNGAYVFVQGDKISHIYVREVK